MFSFRAIFLYCIIAAILTSGQPEDSNKICSNKDSVPLKSTLFKVGLKDEMYITMMRTLNPTTFLDAETPETTEELKTKICFFTKAKTAFGTLDITGNIKYTDPANVRLSATADTGILGKVTLSADLRASKTDNTTYAIYTTCLGGRTPFWVVLAVTPKLAEAVETSIFSHIESLGFNKADAAVPGDPFMGSKISGENCEVENTQVGPKEKEGEKGKGKDPPGNTDDTTAKVDPNANVNGKSREETREALSGTVIQKDKIKENKSPDKSEVLPAESSLEEKEEKYKTTGGKSEVVPAGSNPDGKEEKGKQVEGKSEVAPAKEEKEKVIEEKGEVIPAKSSPEAKEGKKKEIKEENVNSNAKPKVVANKNVVHKTRDPERKNAEGYQKQKGTQEVAGEKVKQVDRVQSNKSRRNSAESPSVAGDNIITYILSVLRTYAKQVFSWACRKN